MDDLERESVERDVRESDFLSWHRKEAFIRASEVYRTAVASAVEGLVCAYCGDPASTFDHVYPRSKGGRDDPRNLVPVCRPCNSAKSGKSLTTWMSNQDQYIRNMTTAQVRMRGIERVMATTPTEFNDE